MSEDERLRVSQTIATALLWTRRFDDMTAGEFLTLCNSTADAILDGYQPLTGERRKGSP